MAQDCFLTFGIYRQMIMMQPGKLSILPLESKQWGISLTDEYGNAWVIFPISFSWDAPIVIPVHYGVNTVWCFVESTQLKKDTAEIVIKNNDGSAKKDQGCAWIAIAK